MKGRFGQDHLTGQHGLREALGHADGPVVVTVIPVCERDQEPGAGEPFHEREKPLRDDRSRAPRTEPARRMNDRRGLTTRAFSSWSRTILPWETPVFAATSSSQTARSLVRRTVIV